VDKGCASEKGMPGIKTTLSSGKIEHARIVHSQNRAHRPSSARTARFGKKNLGHRRGSPGSWKEGPAVDLERVGRGGDGDAGLPAKGTVKSHDEASKKERENQASTTAQKKKDWGGDIHKLYK